MGREAERGPERRRHVHARRAESAASGQAGRQRGAIAQRAADRLGLAGEQHGRLIERIGAQAEARGDRDRVERQTDRWRRRRLAAGHPEAFAVVAHVEAMDRHRSLGGAQLHPHHAADIEWCAVGGEGLLVTNVELVAVPQRVVEIDRQGQRLESVDHRWRRHAGRCCGIGE